MVDDNTTLQGLIDAKRQGIRSMRSRAKRSTTPARERKRLEKWIAQDKAEIEALKNAQRQLASLGSQPVKGAKR
jgi:hypothetical protein